MSRDWERFLDVIKKDWLGHGWKLEMGTEYQTQRFRQRGHERETPQDFMTRRLMLSRFLDLQPRDSKAEVESVLLQIPDSWRLLLDVQTLIQTQCVGSKLFGHP